MVILMPFLYFPEDKTEYIPAVIMLVVFVIGAIVAMKVIRKLSAKELSKLEKSTDATLEPKDDEDQRIQK